MAKERRLLIAFDDVVNALAKEYGSVMDTHIYSPREIINSLGSLHPADAVEVAEYDAIIYKLECLLCHATGGKYSKAGYSLEDMERMVTDYIEECCDEAVSEAVVWCKNCRYYAYGNCRFWGAEIHHDNFCSFGEMKNG